MPRDARPADEIVRVGRLLYERRYVVAGEGNLSARLAPGRFLVTPAGANKGELDRDGLVEVDGDGRPQGPGRPSSEWPLHAEIYRLRPDVAAVCHAHPPRATAFACARRDLPASILPEAVLLLGGEVPLAPYATPGTAEVAASIRPFIERHQAILLSNHGVVAVGGTLEEAYRRLEVVERVAEVALDAEKLGGAVRLTTQQVRKLNDGSR
ncbi:MAG: class II aldolase/adducin family protein [Candidatus Latescibacteria bacterium]|nr:class II aldolase/adducin family protein [Candidatus Latescibacterota bacterium]